MIQRVYLLPSDTSVRALLPPLEAISFFQKLRSNTHQSTCLLGSMEAKPRLEVSPCNAEAWPPLLAISRWRFLSIDAKPRLDVSPFSAEACPPITYVNRVLRFYWGFYCTTAAD
jgi:hypothetical protein